MASRLYRSTHGLYSAVALAPSQLHIGDLGSPTAAVLVTLYVTGLILLDARQVTLGDCPLPAQPVSRCAESSAAGDTLLDPCAAGVRRSLGEVVWFDRSPLSG